MIDKLQVRIRTYASFHSFPVLVGPPAISSKTRQALMLPVRQLIIKGVRPSPRNKAEQRHAILNLHRNTTHTVQPLQLLALSRLCWLSIEYSSRTYLAIVVYLWHLGMSTAKAKQISLLRVQNLGQGTCVAIDMSLVAYEQPCNVPVEGKGRP